MGQRIFTLAACAALAVLTSTGCSTQPSRLVLRSPDHTFEKIFTQAYAGRTSDGRREFVLVSDDSGPAATNAGEPIRPTGQAPLRQVVYVKVLYVPMKGIDATAPTANAAIDWYVLSDGAAGRTDVLEYQGAGLVSVISGDHTSTLVIRNGSVKPGAARGNLVDPLGPAELSGTITAVNDPARAHELIESTRTRISLALQATAQSAAAR